MTPEQEELFGRIEADQKLIRTFIDDSKRLCDRSDVLMNAARDRRKPRESAAGAEQA